MAAGRPRPTWDARKVQVFVDATIALLIVAHALRERMEGVERRGAVFDLGEDGGRVRYG